MNVVREVDADRRICQPFIVEVIWCCRHCRCRGAGRVGKAGDRRIRRGERWRERVAKVPGGAGRGRGRGRAAVPAVLRGAAVAGAGAAAPGGALPARQPRVPRGRLRALLRAPQLRAQPHADQAPPPVGEDENAQMELRLGQLARVSCAYLMNRPRRSVKATITQLARIYLLKSL